MKTRLFTYLVDGFPSKIIKAKNAKEAKKLWFERYNEKVSYLLRVDIEYFEKE